MAHQIDIARVSACLLADGWHYITPGSFRIEAFQFVASAAEGMDGEAAGTAPALALPQSAGFTFEVTDQISREVQLFTGRLSSLLAARHAPVMEVVTD